MSRLARLRRRSDHGSAAHDRARRLAADRLATPLDAKDAARLEEHLAGCPGCTDVAQAYERDRLALRALAAADRPEPPRDLWARTAAAIEGASGRAASPPASDRRGAARRWPVGALSGIAVMAVVIGATALSGRGPFGGPTQVGDPGVALASPTIVATQGPGATPAPRPTPIVVGAGDVAWIDRGPGGSLGYAAVEVDEVCAQEVGSGCAVLGDGRRASVELMTAPRAVIGSPDGEQAIAISEDEDGADRLTVVQLPAVDTAGPTPPPTESPRATAIPTTSAPPTPDPGSTPVLSPEPTIATTVAIATDVVVVGDTAAFSADGSRFAFTARPADGSRGPDVYLWHVGDATASLVTDDGASVFASWSGDGLVVSRPVDPESAESEAKSVRLDPATGAEVELGGLWRPVVDPTGTFAIAWDGSVGQTGGSDAPWLPVDGSLELVAWSDDGAEPLDGSARDRRITDEAAGGYDVRWDETGEWLAVWVADPLDPAIGRLTLYHLDREDGRLERVDDAPVEVPALPGFSIGDGRLAWATPRGQGGEGSRVQIAAWRDGDVGIVESTPGEGIVVVR